jgi:hypothetical protein
MISLKFKSFAFSDCSILESFTVPSPVSALGDSVFSYCSKLASVTFEDPSHLTNIPPDLFCGCPLLQTLKLPDSVPKIAGYAFKRSGVTAVDGADCMIANSLIIHHAVVLHSFGSPSRVIIPAAVETIGDRCFEKCDNPKTIAFDDSSKLKRIGKGAFAEFGLRSITIPASTEEIDGSAFVGCPILKTEIAPGS